MSDRLLAPPAVSSPGRNGLPTISVVIAAYQAAATVGGAVSSALAQTVPPHEVIVVDDGSTDDLDAALSPFADRIMALRKENGGVSTARNLGARIATGSHIDFLDADDLFDPRRHAALVEAFTARPDIDIVVTDNYLEVDGVAVATYYGKNRFEVSDQRREILRRCFVPTPVCVRRDRFLAEQGYDEGIRIGEDWDCWIRMILSGSRVGLVDAPLATYRVTEGSLASDRVKQWPVRAAVLEKTLGDRRLSNGERDAVRSRIEDFRRDECLANVEAALAAGAPDSRRRSLAVARRGDVPRWTRARALVAAAAPRSASRYVRRRWPDGTRLTTRRFD